MSSANVIRDTYLTERSASNAHYSRMIDSELRNEWRTPDTLMTKLVEQFGQFDIDAAANRFNTKCRRFNSSKYPRRHKWVGNVFCNPPYSGNPKILTWVKMGYRATAEHGAQCVFVLPVQTGCLWFQNWASRGDIYLIKGRVSFVPPAGIKAGSPRHDTLIVRFTRDNLNGKRHKPNVTLWDLDED